MRAYAELLAQLRREVIEARRRTGDNTIAVQGRRPGLFRIVSLPPPNHALPVGVRFVQHSGWVDVVDALACARALQRAGRVAESG